MNILGLFAAFVWTFCLSSALQASPYKYPAGPGLDQSKWDKSRKKADALIARMSLMEKSLVVTGTFQETQRKPTEVIGIRTEAVSSNIDDRTMHEVYLWPFADAVHAGVASVMCAYNRVNGTYAGENSKLLKKLLKEELGFEGYVCSDFIATMSGVKSAKAGLDLNLPGPISPTDLKNSHYGVNLLHVVGLDEMVRRVLVPYYYHGQASKTRI